MSVGLAWDRQAALAFRAVVNVLDICKSEVYFQGLPVGGKICRAEVLHDEVRGPKRHHAISLQ